VHLEGIHTLYMRDCNQPTITDAAFAHLRGIHALDMSGCNQRSVTPRAFSRLAGVSWLCARGCELFFDVDDVAYLGHGALECTMVDLSYHHAPEYSQQFDDDEINEGDSSGD